MQQIIDKDAIQLKFKVKNLLNRDLQKADNVFCKIFLKNGNEEELLITQTNVATLGLNQSLYKGELHFFPYTLVNFTFELIQTIRVEMYERNGQGFDHLIAQVIRNVGQIVARRYFMTDIITIQKIGEMRILAEREKEQYIQLDKNTNYMLWWGEKLLDTNFFSKSDPFLIFYKMMYEKWEKVLETYYIENNLNPKWDVIEISDDLLYRDNPQQLIKIECWAYSNSGKHTFIGETITSKKEIQNQRREFILSNNGKTKGFGTLKLCYEKGHIPKFIDYLICLEKLNLMIGIDFTESNGNPEQPKSLHYLNDHKLNQYQQTIKAFGDIVLYYIDQYQYYNIEMFGFGGIPNGSFWTKFCFPLNDNEEHPIKDNIKDVFQVYDNSVKQVKQSGPTYVAELLKHAKNHYKFSDGHHYLILLIITDGIINDIKETKQLILDCEQLPISIIFVGVGDEDFSEMKKLFQNPDVTRNNYRQIHQFESFKDYNDPVSLMQAALNKIPEQYLKYKKINGRGPYNYFKNHI